MRQRKQNQTVSSQSRSQKPSCVRTSILAIEPAIRWDGSHSVTDLETARTRLLQRGVEVGEIRHKTPIGAWDGGFAPGLDPARRDYASFANFCDPDGNSWMLQERGYRKV